MSKQLINKYFAAVERLIQLSGKANEVVIGQALSGVPPIAWDYKPGKLLD